MKILPLNLCLFFLQVCWVALPVAGQDKIDFAHDIMPVLQQRCAECHSNGQYKGGLSLETRESLADSGTIEIGSRTDSDLFERITSDEEDFRMPPEGGRLTQAEIEAIGKWIDSGLAWPSDLTLKKPTFKRPLGLRSVDLPGATNGTDHPIDRLLNQYFNANEIQATQPLSDAAFYRRAKLDLLGLLPTSAELDAIASSRLDRNSVVDELLGQNRRYADHWMTFWNDLLRNDYVGTGYIDGGRTQITEWLHRSLLENKPYDQFVRELINPGPDASGFIKGIQWRGRVNASQVRELQFSQNISQVFLGINMKCASCHDSFIDDWKLKDAYGLAAIIADQPLEIHRCDVSTDEIATSKFVFPSVGEIDSSLSKTERLNQLAELMTDQKNGRFARTIVNRLWHRMMGRGLVHPVDVMANQAWSETLLDFLAKDLVDHGYDLKRTLKLIATSSAYQSQSVIEAEAIPAGEPFVFHGTRAKRMTAEQFVDAVWQLSGTHPSQPDAKIGFDDSVEIDNAKPVGKWIWNTKLNASQAAAGEALTFRKKFDLDRKPDFAKAVVSCDNSFVAFVNGKRVGKGSDWSSPVTIDLSNHLKPGTNEIVVRAKNGGNAPNPAAFFFEGMIHRDDSNWITSGSDWLWTDQKVDPANPAGTNAWNNAEVVGSFDETYTTATDAFRRAIAKMGAKTIFRFVLRWFSQMH